jgi:DNA-binding NtrC family response regulator
MNKLIHILHLEDDPADAELIQARIDDADLACRITRVRTRDEFLRAPQHHRYDIVLADYRLPKFDGISALRLVQERYPEVPFIFVSGTMGEEAAIEAMARGATDYVLKQDLKRLGPAVKRALQEARNRRERRLDQEALQPFQRRPQTDGSGAERFHVPGASQRPAPRTCRGRSPARGTRDAG